MSRKNQTFEIIVFPTLDEKNITFRKRRRTTTEISEIKKVKLSESEEGQVKKSTLDEFFEYEQRACKKINEFSGIINSVKLRLMCELRKKKKKKLSNFMKDNAYPKDVDTVDLFFFILEQFNAFEKNVLLSDTIRSFDDFSQMHFDQKFHHINNQIKVRKASSDTFQNKYVSCSYVNNHLDFLQIFYETHADIFENYNITKEKFNNFRVLPMQYLTRIPLLISGAGKVISKKLKESILVPLKDYISLLTEALNNRSPNDDSKNNQYRQLTNIPEIKAAFEISRSDTLFSKSKQFSKKQPNEKPFLSALKKRIAMIEQNSPVKNVKRKLDFHSKLEMN